LPKAQARTPPSTILVCEDEASLRELVRLSLGDGYRFLEATDGAAALELVRRTHPVLDVMLPGMSGLHVIRTVRGEPAVSATPVVAISAWTHLEGEALEAGADCFVGKPFEPETLRACVEKLLAHG
jgi:CheY-like chemotaxis protein